ncbi:MAG: hypothetical protein K2X38_12355 [Gemmataceae bacterium]|nr:hypothetical protein [Gemmataceae bacterium]
MLLCFVSDFKENAVGYQFVHNDIVRVDSEYIHADAVVPALTLMHEGGSDFKGCQDEFLEAHEHYRRGRNKEAVQSAAKSFESVMKAICTLRKRQFDPQKDAAAVLVGILFKEELIPQWLQDHFSALRNVSRLAFLSSETNCQAQGMGEGQK